MMRFAYVRSITANNKVVCRETVVAGAEPRALISFPHQRDRGDAPAESPPGHCWPAIRSGKNTPDSASFCPSHRDRAVFGGLKFRFSPVLAIALALVALWLSTANGQNIVNEEVRDFDIFVKDKPAGKSTMRISDSDDGTTRVATEVDVKLNVVVFVYHYQFFGQEVWRGNRLLSTANQAIDGGTKYDARADGDARGFRIEANGRSRGTSMIDMTTNYWRPPELRQDGSLALMNADRGTVHAARVERLPNEALLFGSQQVTCSRYRLSGDVQTELWFDGQNRIVRQKGIEDGYPTEIRLTRVTRQAPRMAARPQQRPPVR